MRCAVVSCVNLSCEDDVLSTEDEALEIFVTSSGMRATTREVKSPSLCVVLEVSSLENLFITFSITSMEGAGTTFIISGKKTERNVRKANGAASLYVYHTGSR